MTFYAVHPFHWGMDWPSTLPLMGFPNHRLPCVGMSLRLMASFLPTLQMHPHTLHLPVYVHGAVA